MFLVLGFVAAGQMLMAAPRGVIQVGAHSIARCDLGILKVPVLGATACGKFGKVTLKDGFLASVYYGALKTPKFDNIGNQYIIKGSITKFVENESGDHGRSGMRKTMFISWPGYHTSKYSLKMFDGDYC